MNSLKSLIAILLFLGATPAISKDTGERMLLKNWAVSRCLGQVYSDQAVKDDANATAAAYLENGHLPIEAYQKLDELITQYIRLDYRSAGGSALVTMKCLDLFNSKELENLVTKFAAKVSP